MLTLRRHASSYSLILSSPESRDKRPSYCTLGHDDFLVALSELESLYQQGFISCDIYFRVKTILIDTATGTKALSSESKQKHASYNSKRSVAGSEQRRFSKTVNSQFVGLNHSHKHAYRPPEDIYPHFTRRINGVPLLKLLSHLHHDDHEAIERITQIVHHLMEETPKDGFLQEVKDAERLKLLEEQIEEGFLFSPSLTKNPFSTNTAPAERAFKYTLDADTLEWSKSDILVKIDPIPFARGSFRKAQYCVEITDTNRDHSGIHASQDNIWNDPNVLHCVAKVSIDPSEDPDTYFRDVWVQTYSEKLAREFNSYDPPKRIRFVEAWVIELIDRPNKPLYNVECFIEGEYEKHNNNTGFVSIELERNTPQAFSHFTYEVSNHQLLVCDIQGVNDVYTDPQIHSILNVDFGKGNLKHAGIHTFLRTHRCNLICQYLHLKSTNDIEVREGGTIPETATMSFDTIGSISIASVPSTESIFLLNQLVGIDKAPGLRAMSEEENQEAKLRLHGWEISSNSPDSYRCPCLIL